MDYILSKNEILKTPSQIKSWVHPCYLLKGLYTLSEHYYNQCNNINCLSRVR